MEIEKAKLVPLVSEIVAKILNIPVQEIDPKAEFQNLGVDSLTAMYILEELEKQLKIEVNPLHFWEYPTIDAFCSQLVKEH